MADDTEVTTSIPEASLSADVTEISDGLNTTVTASDTPVPDLTASPPEPLRLTRRLERRIADINAIGYTACGACTEQWYDLVSKVAKSSLAFRELRRASAKQGRAALSHDEIYPPLLEWGTGRTMDQMIITRPVSELFDRERRRLEAEEEFNASYAALTSESSRRFQELADVLGVTRSAFDTLYSCAASNSPGCGPFPPNEHLSRYLLRHPRVATAYIAWYGQKLAAVAADL